MITTSETIAGIGRKKSVIVVIGGGFSGAAIATHLALQATSPVRITMIEPRAAIGRGVAYAGTREHLLLNVPAGRLSIDPARPGDFHHWATSAGRASDPGRFLPRVWFGAYAAARLDEALDASRGLAEIVRVCDTAAGIRPQADGLRVTTRHGASFFADHAVLAIGHGPTRMPAVLGGLCSDRRLLRSLWDEGGMERLARSTQRIVLVGTGLTMFDAAISLRRLGFRGKLVAVSRRGVTPRPHGPNNAQDHARWAENIQQSELRSLVRAVRERARGGDWRGVVDSLRPHTQRLWRSMPQADRERFLSRVAVYWDVHRHRCPPEVDREIVSMINTGDLRHIRGHITAATPHADAIRLRVGGTSLEAEGVVLCTGPDPDPRCWGSSLMEGMFADGLASADPLGLGLRTDDRGFLLGADGAPSPTLSTLGPLRRGELWESTAVPEISAQARDTASAILSGLGRHDPDLKQRLYTGYRSVLT